MTLLLIICMVIVGGFLLYGLAVGVFAGWLNWEGIRAVALILGAFVVAYIIINIIITFIVHIVRIYYNLPPLPWEWGEPD